MYGHDGVSIMATLSNIHVVFIFCLSEINGITRSKSVETFDLVRVTALCAIASVYWKYV